MFDFKHNFRNNFLINNIYVGGTTLVLKWKLSRLF